MRLRAISFLLVGIFVAGCTTTPPTPATKVKPVAKGRPHIAILVSQPIPAYTEIAQRLKQRLGDRGTVYNLPKVRDGSYHDVEGVESLQLASIGLDASRITDHLHHQQVFCQVFNYNGSDLTGPHSKGVSMMPGLGKTFSTWKSLAPGLKDVAVISGSGLEALLKPAIKLASEHGIKLHHRTVNNDKEYLYTYKQMAKRVQGYLLVPDNRVLSVDALRDVMNYSVRNGKQVVVFNDELLSLGGLMSASTSYDEIVDKVLLRLKQAEGRDDIPGPELLPLDDAVFSINEVMAKRLNLTIPKEYRGYVNARGNP